MSINCSICLLTHNRVDVAMQKCPQLVCIHVETRDEKGKGDGGTIQAPQAQQSPQHGSQQQPRHDPGSQKACLDRYREASEEVMAVMARFAATIEKASIDEAYLEIDLSGQGGKGKGSSPGGEAADDEEEQEDDGAGGYRDGQAFTEQELVGIDGHRVDPDSPIDRPLLLGARVVARLRRAVLAETGFTVSAGIAHNKMLAKLSSARNKPDKQTIVPASAVAALMATIPVKEIRGLGGKLGDAVLAFLDEKEGRRAPAPGPASGQQEQAPQQQPQQRMAVELQAAPEAELRARFGAKEAAWLHRICRGGCVRLSLCLCCDDRSTHQHHPNDPDTPTKPKASTMSPWWPRRRRSPSGPSRASTRYTSPRMSKLGCRCWRRIWCVRIIDVALPGCVNGYIWQLAINSPFT